VRVLLEYGAKDAGSNGWHCILLAAERGHAQVRLKLSLSHLATQPVSGCFHAPSLRQQRQYNRYWRMDSASSTVNFCRLSFRTHHFGQVACENGHLEAVKLLISKRADIEVKTNSSLP
jgi:hypothetical protein